MRSRAEKQEVRTGVGQTEMPLFAVHGRDVLVGSGSHGPFFFFSLFFEPSVVASQGRYLNDTSGHGGEFDGHKLQVKCLKAR